MAATPTPNSPQDRAPRRLVLLTGDEQSEAAQVVAEYSGTGIGATKIHADLLRAAEEHPGQFAAVEWMSSIGWRRYLWCKR
jgi:hypothetical protein